MLSAGSFDFDGGCRTYVRIVGGQCLAHRETFRPHEHDGTHGGQTACGKALSCQLAEGLVDVCNDHSHGSELPPSAVLGDRLSKLNEQYDYRTNPVRE